MKTFRVPLALLLLTPAAFSQDPVSAEPAPTTPNSIVAVERTDEELEQLLAPMGREQRNRYAES